ncbi:hypothetical protein [Enterobacter soli]|uniref:hypothetical protein n=1 Tax=Enterobacter soli TaxID=885040 RepID=UPI002F41AECA
MNTTSKLPNKLYRALSELKSYLERMPLGVSLPAVKKKVGILSTLNNKELETLLGHVSERESIHVYTLVAENNAGAEGVQYLRAGRYGNPIVPSGFILAGPHQKSTTQTGGVKEEPAKIETHQKEAATVSRTATQSTPITSANKSAAQLRKEAEDLLRQAEDAERASEQSDLFKKRLGPIKLELLQSTNAIKTHLDGLIDGISALEKACDKIKAITA